MRHALLVILWWVTVQVAMAQPLLQGRVIDQRTREPLAFVHVVVDGAGGTSSDIAGHFTLPVSGWPATVRCSYVGYEPLVRTIPGPSAVLFEMRPLPVELAAVTVRPDEEPARRIIERAYANRKVNDGRSMLAHRYRAYSKTIFTVAVDSALLADTARRAVLDTSDQRLLDFTERNHILLMESATRCSFRPPAGRSEEVLNMRVSGLQDPSLLALAASTRSWSVYAPTIELGEKRYPGPLGPGTMRDHLFLIEDTLYQHPDTVFILSFRPRPGKSFDGLKGLLWIHTDGYAVQNVVMRPAAADAGVDLRVRQQHERITRPDGTRAWFPVQLDNTLVANFLQVNDWKLMGITSTWLMDIELDAEVKRHEVSGPELVADGLLRRRGDDEALWDSLRMAPLDDREQRTYQVIDSLGDAEGLDRRVQGLGALLNGAIPWGPVEFPLERLLAYNGYEGFRLGLGLRTNARMSRRFSVGGWFAYGFQDRAWKYGGEAIIRPMPTRDLELRLSHAWDVAETGGWSFHGPRPTFSSESYRMLYVDRMDGVERTAAEMGMRLAKGLKVHMGTRREWRQDRLGYRYAFPVAEEVTLIQADQLAGAVTFGLRYAFREVGARTPTGYVPLTTSGPVVLIDAWRAVEGLWEGDVEAWRVVAQLEHTWRHRRKALRLRVVGGMADPQAPAPFLFNLRGSWNDRLPVATAFTFETMRPNEFLVDRFLAMHLRLDPGIVLYDSKLSRPAPLLIASAAIGHLDRPELHRGWDFKPLDGVYQEVGLHIDGLLRSGVTSLGVMGALRLGDPAFGDLRDDGVVKLTLGIDL